MEGKKPITSPPVTENQPTDSLIPTKKSDIEIVRETREQLKSENDALEAELTRKEQLRAQAIIGGKSEMTPPIKEETPQDYAKRLIAKPYGDVKVEVPD